MELFKQWLTFILIILIVKSTQIQTTKAIEIGVCYGLLGNNLPSPTDVINLYKKNNIEKLRLFDPNPGALNALRGSGISTIVGIVNNDLPNLAASPEAVQQWFSSQIEPYLDNVKISTIAVGNEVIPGNLGQYVLPVMESLNHIIRTKGLSIRVSTVVPGTVLANSYPPSASVFTEEVKGVVRGVLGFLSLNNFPLLVNVYPYFAYAADSAHVRLDYAQFTASGAVVQDGSLSYQNLFDAMLDTFFWAMEKEGFGGVSIVVAESGWPSDGNGQFTTHELAATYNKNYIKHITSKSGTPKRPGLNIEGFIFAMFNENQKPPGTEQNLGLFYPNMQPVYPVFS